MAIAMLSRKLGLTMAAGLTALTLSACALTVATRGNLVDDTRLAQIQPGVTTRDDVAYLLGTPTTTSTFEKNIWYYIGQRTEKSAFFDPEIVERRVVEITFDDQGVVREIEEIGLEDGQEIELVDRQTPTLGKQITFLEQMLGNFGRGMGRVQRTPGSTNLP